MNGMFYYPITRKTYLMKNGVCVQFWSGYKVMKNGLWELKPIITKRLPF